jgi:hypothetical protein
MKATANWIKEHDDRWSFIVLYIGGAVALSIWLNLFWVIMLMLVHFVLEIARGLLLQVRRPLMHALWEVKLDIALVLFALVVALYSEHVMAMLGLGQAARAGQAARGLQLATRFAIIERALRIIVLTMDDFARLVQASLKLRNRRNAAPAGGEAQLAAAVGPAAAAGDMLSLAFGAACLALILLLPSLIGTPADELTVQILHEISPFR